MKIIIESITEWERDEAVVADDRHHGGLPESDILTQLAAETRMKKESEWTKGLPFVWERGVKLVLDETADIGRDVQSYLDDALAEYSIRHCDGDYLKPSRFEGRIVA